MPVRSLNSSRIKWPELEKVHAAVCSWAKQKVVNRPEILQIGYIGSYARGDWGVGSDLDVIVITEFTNDPFWRRGLDFDLSGFPVPVDLLVYTQQEWQELAQQTTRFYQTVMTEAVWVYSRADLNHHT
jgi:predicted nucleotidyltransferase